MTGSLAVLALTSHEIVHFFLFLRKSNKLGNDSSIVSYICIGGNWFKTNSQNMLFRYGSANLNLAYLNREPSH